MSRLWGRTSAAVIAGALAAGAAGLAWSQQAPTSAAPPAAAPPTAPPPARAEEPPPPAASVPTTVAPGPTPEAPPQEISPAPPPAAESSTPSSKSSDATRAPPPPPKRTLYNAAILQAVDKVTAETLRFEVQVRQPVRYKGLIFTLHTCETSPAGVTPSAYAHLEVDSQPQPLPGRPPNPAKQVFKGWMVADAPGLHPLEHPVYDAWLIACKTGSGPGSAKR